MKILNHVTMPKQTAYYEKDILINLHFEFTTNNRIFFPNGQHKDLYNHTYAFDISIKSPVNKFGLAIDFYQIEHDYTKHIAPHLNATVLNAALPEMNTTVENIAYYIWQQFEKILNNATITTLTLYETKLHSVTLTEEMMK